MVEAATANGKIDQEGIRQRLMEYYTKIQILRINGLRNLTATLNASKDLGTIALGATNKMFWSEMHKAAMELAVDIYGAEGMLIDAPSNLELLDLDRCLVRLAELDPRAALFNGKLGRVETEHLVVGLIVAVAAPGVEHGSVASGLGVEEFRGGGEAAQQGADDRRLQLQEGPR